MTSSEWEVTPSDASVLYTGPEEGERARKTQQDATLEEPSSAPGTDSTSRREADFSTTKEAVQDQFEEGPIPDKEVLTAPPLKAAQTQPPPTIHQYNSLM